jgi:hypothetical protein
MAYTKPQMLCRDEALTYQAVNIVQDNQYEGWLQFAKWHGTQEYLTGPFGIGGVRPPPALLFGVHNDRRIPRAAVQFLAASFSSANVALPNPVSSSPEVLGQVTYQSTGVIDVVCNLTEYYAECTPFGVGLSGNLRFVTPTSIFPSQGTRGSLRFELFELNGTSGAFEPADFDFVAFVYGAP